MGLLLVPYAFAQGPPQGPGYGNQGYPDQGYGNQAYADPGYAQPVYVGPPPACPYGYYPVYPYACAPYGYYGPSWFSGGIFIGAGPWGFGHGWRGFSGGRGFGGRGYYGGQAFSGRGGFRAGVGNGYSGRAFSGGRALSDGGRSFGGGGGHAFTGAAVDMAEAEVVMVVDAGRFHPLLEVLAADSTRCRPLRFRSRGQTAGRAPALCERFFLNRQLRPGLLASLKARDFIMIGNPEAVRVARRENSRVPHGT